VNVPSVEVTVRDVKMDAISANGIERIEIYKTLSADQDADGIGGTVNIVTPTAQDKPTYSMNGTASYNPLQNGNWRGGFDGTFGHRWGPGKEFGFLIGGSWDRGLTATDGHNDSSIAAYQWSLNPSGTQTSDPNDPIVGLKEPTGDNYFLSPYTVRCAGTLSHIQGNSDRSLGS
jgi:hypothetical protein